MSQYQKHLGNAIIRQPNRYLFGLAFWPIRSLLLLLQSSWRIGGLLLLSIFVGMVDPPSALFASPGYNITIPATITVATPKVVTRHGVLNGVLTASLAPSHLLQQSAGTVLLPPLVIPLESTSVELLTHTADFTLSTADSSTGESALTLEMDATYRLENGASESAALILNVTEPKSAGILVEIGLTADGIPLTLFQTEGIGYTAQLQINADTRTTVTLRYVVTATDFPLPLLSYHATTLSAWRGNPSIRVSIALPSGVVPESWLHVAPAEWRYAQIADNRLPGIKWLYDAQIPESPFVFEFIHPNQWLRLQQLATDAKADSALFINLGEQYQRLLSAVPSDPAYNDVRTRFYSQALAAYTAGIDQLIAAGRSGSEIGALYRALAALYRGQVARADGSTDPAYATAMVEAAQEALSQFPTTDEHRTELSQWVADGLQVMLAEAQSQDAWPTALAIIEQLATLPPEMVNRDILERTKRSITVRQALQLLEENNRSAALALAGDDLLDTQLLPAPAEQALFSRWEFSTTITPAMIEVAVQPMSTPARQGAALAEFEQLIDQLRTAVDPAITLAWQPVGALALSDTEATNPNVSDPTTTGTTLTKVGQLIIRSPSDSSFASLTTAMPALPKWLLFYTLLRQLQPVVETQRSWVSQATTVRLSLDLHAVATEWQQVAASLETQAAQLDAEAAGRNARDATEAESALRARIQAANYRSAAQDWRNLARDSWVLLQLTIPSGLQTPVRTWLITVDSPVQVAELQSTPSTFVSFIGFLILGMALLLLFSGLLWWLL